MALSKANVINGQKPSQPLRNVQMTMFASILKSIQKNTNLNCQWIQWKIAILRLQYDHLHKRHKKHDRYKIASQLWLKTHLKIAQPSAVPLHTHNKTYTLHNDASHMHSDTCFNIERAPTILFHTQCQIELEWMMSGDATSCEIDTFAQCIPSVDSHKKSKRRMVVVTAKYHFFKRSRGTFVLCISSASLCVCLSTILFLSNKKKILLKRIQIFFFKKKRSFFPLCPLQKTKSSEKKNLSWQNYQNCFESPLSRI